MKIELLEVAKRYRLDWILRGLNLNFESGHQYAITGPNGSGKSTLLKLLSGHLTPSKGKRIFSLHGKPLDIDQVYQHLSYAAPYIDLIEEFSLKEALDFHQKFKPFHPPLDTKAMIELLGFKRSKNKTIRNFSSGMKQRLKLALAICSNTSLLLLDEPTTNLDKEGAAWYHQLMHDFAKDRLIIVASNVETDLHFCDIHIDILDFK